MRYLILLLLVVSCGKQPSLSTDEVNSEPDDTVKLPPLTCKVAQLPNGAEISCPDGSKVFIANGTNGVDGSNGVDGLNGLNGVDGQSCVTTQTNSGATIDCGNTTANITNGVNGVDGQSIVGQTGATGPAGSDGFSIVMTTLPATEQQCPNGGTVLIFAQDTLRLGVYDIMDEGQNSAIVCNGLNGATGAPGQNGVTSVQKIEYIAPCGNTVAFKEQLLCMTDGNILATVSDNIAGYNTRLSFITEGTWINTDNSGCIFTVSKVLNNGYNVSWNGGGYHCKVQ